MYITHSLGRVLGGMTQWICYPPIALGLYFTIFFAKFGPFLPENKFAKFEALLPRMGASEARHGIRGADAFAVGKKIAKFRSALSCRMPQGPALFPKAAMGYPVAKKPRVCWVKKNKKHVQE